MRTVEAHSRKSRAVRRARELQRDAPSSKLLGVEFDKWKEPYPYRVVRFDLNDERDRSYIKPIDTERVSGVRVVMFARRIVVALPRPAAPDLIGEYKAKRRQRRQKRKVAA